MPNRRGSARRIGLLGLIVASAIPLGCGAEGPSRLPVSGSVKVDGQPLAKGTITFVPEAGQTAATAEVADGTFRLGASDGPSPGSYRVEIVAVEPTGKTVPHPDLPGATIEEVRNLIPPRYNVRTELTADIKDAAENALSFDLSTRRASARASRR